MKSNTPLHSSKSLFLSKVLEITAGRTQYTQKLNSLFPVVVLRHFTSSGMTSLEEFAAYKALVNFLWLTMITICDTWSRNGRK